MNWIVYRPHFDRVFPSHVPLLAHAQQFSSRIAYWGFQCLCGHTGRINSRRKIWYTQIKPGPSGGRWSKRDPLQFAHCIGYYDNSWHLHTVAAELFSAHKLLINFHWDADCSATLMQRAWPSVIHGYKPGDGEYRLCDIMYSMTSSLNGAEWWERLQLDLFCRLSNWAGREVQVYCLNPFSAVPYHDKHLGSYW